MKTFLEFFLEDFSPSMQSWLKNVETTKKMQAREPAEPSKFGPSDSDWASKMRDKFDSAIAKKREVEGPKDIFLGSRHSAGPNDVEVTPDKPMISKSNVVKKALADRGYNEIGKKVTSIPKNTGVDRTNVSVGSFPQKKSISVAIPKAKPAELKTKETFKQIFARTPEGQKFTWNGKTYLRKTKK